MSDIRLVDSTKVSESGGIYSRQTSDELIDVIEGLVGEKHRLIFYYGDQKTGKRWLPHQRSKILRDEGSVAFHAGALRVPLVIFNRDSKSGVPLLTDQIVQIDWRRQDAPRLPVWKVTPQ